MQTLLMLAALAGPMLDAGRLSSIQEQDPLVLVQRGRRLVTDGKHAEAIALYKQALAARPELPEAHLAMGIVLDLMGRFDFAVGMRLHFLIFAALRGTPFSPLPYASKVSGLLEDLGLDTPELGSIGIGQLIGRIDRKWDTREEIRAQLRERVPALRERARQTNQSLLRLLSQVR